MNPLAEHELRTNTATLTPEVAYLSLSEAAKMFPGRGGRPLNPATLTRWAINGVKLPSGERLRLRAKRIGSRWLTVAEWMHEFIESHTAAFVGESQVAMRSPTERNHAADLAGAELARMGVNRST